MLTSLVNGGFSKTIVYLLSERTSPRVVKLPASPLLQLRLRNTQVRARRKNIDTTDFINFLCNAYSSTPACNLLTT